MVKTGAMTFLEAALDILKREGRPLHFKELTERAMTKKLLTFVGRTPEVTMQTQLTTAVKKAPRALRSACVSETAIFGTYLSWSRHVAAMAMVSTRLNPRSEPKSYR